MKKNLFHEILKYDKKILLYKKKSISLKQIKILINKKAKKIKKFKKGIISISTQNKLDFIINFYACNKINYPVFLTDNKSKSKNLNESININYILKKNDLIKIHNKFQKNYSFNIVIKSSGSSSNAKYVHLKNESISHVCREMNRQMNKNKIFNELIFAPLYHAFGFGRLHALMTGHNNITLTDFYSISNFYNLIIENRIINAVSIPSKILSIVLKFKKKLITKLFLKIKYFQVSTGYFEPKFRKKILEQNINLFLNYGMTEAIRTTFFHVNKYKNKLHTEGKPINGVKIKIIKENSEKYGLILVKGKNLAYGYNNRKEWNKKFLQGYFNTGDIGYLDKDNFLIFKSRLGNKINVNGKSYFTENIEELIKNYLKIEKLKIIRNDDKFYLISEKKINNNALYVLLRQKKINITFDKILYSKILFTETGKFKFTNIKRLING